MYYKTINDVTFITVIVINANYKARGQAERKPWLQPGLALVIHNPPPLFRMRVWAAFKGGFFSSGSRERGKAL